MKVQKFTVELKFEDSSEPDIEPDEILEAIENMVTFVYDTPTILVNEIKEQ